MPSLQSRIMEYLIRNLQIFRTDNLDLQTIRSRSEKAAWLGKPYRDTRVITVSVNSVPAEWLIPPHSPEDRALLYIHGGAWCMGSTTTHRAMVSRIAYASEVRALSINYRLAPEHPFPAGLEDCLAAYDWLVQNGIASHKIIVAGDSAGGNLTLALLVALRDQGKSLPAGAIAISPATDLAFTGKSNIDRKHLDPLFSKGVPNTWIPDYITGYDPHDPLISPLYADLKGLPPILLHVGDHEILLDDSVRFGERAIASGVDAKTVVWPGMFHVFQLWAPILPEALRAIDQMAAFIQGRMSDK